MIHRAPINSNVVLTWSADLSLISRRLNTADLIARFSERRIKDSAFEQRTAIGIGDRRSTVVSQCRNNNVRLLSATAGEINVFEIDWAGSYVPPPLPSPSHLLFLCRRFYKRTDAKRDKFMDRRTAKSNYHINTDVIVSLLIYAGLISHKRPKATINLRFRGEAIACAISRNRGGFSKEL